MKAFLCCILASFSCLSLSAQEISEPQLWNVLSSGNFSLGHKMVLTRPSSSTNDEILSQFMMAYLYFKMGKSVEEIVDVIRGVDYYVGHIYGEEAVK